MSSFQCINCNVRLTRLRRHSLADENEDLVNTIRLWIYPRDITAIDHICHPCWQLADNASSEDIPSRRFGHMHICIICGRSLSRSVKHVLSTDEEQRVLNVISGWIQPRQLNVSSGDEVCIPCWRRAQRNSLKNLSPQLELQPVECMMIPYGEGEVHSPENIAWLQEHQQIQVDNRLHEDGNSGTIQLPKAKEIIISVYRYLQTEYENLKSNIGSNCDLTPLGDILKRTAEATGVSEQTVTSLLEKGKRPLEPTHQTVQRKRAKSNYYFEGDDVSPIDEESSSEEKSEGRHADDSQKAQSSREFEMVKVEVVEGDEHHSDAIEEKCRVDIEGTSCETESAVLNLLSTTHSHVKDEPVDYHEQTSSAVEHLLCSEQIKKETSDINYWECTAAVPHVPPDAVHDPLKTELYDDD